MKKEFYIDIFCTSVFIHIVEDVQKGILSETGYDPGADASAYAWESSGKHGIVCNAMFRVVPSDGDVVHESVHVANMIMRRIGIKADLDNDEAQAYLIEHVYKKTSEIISKFNEQKVRNTHPA